MMIESLMNSYDCLLRYLPHQFHRRSVYLRYLTLHAGSGRESRRRPSQEMMEIAGSNPACRVPVGPSAPRSTGQGSGPVDLEVVFEQNCLQL